MTTLQFIPLPFQESYVTIHEYDTACRIRINGEPQKIVSRYIIGGALAEMFSDVEIIPLLLVKAQSDE